MITPARVRRAGLWPLFNRATIRLAAAARRPLPGHALLHVLDLPWPVAEGLLGQRRLHEFVEITVEHRARVWGRHAGAQVLHHLIGLEHVRADLVAPADVGFRSLLDLRLRLALLDLQIGRA